MEVMAGYKQTEVGVIPKDWEVKPLSSVSSYTNGKAHEGGISDFGKYIVVNSKFISTNGEVRKYSDQRLSPASKGEILMVMSDVPNGRAIARCFFVDRDDLYTVNQRICALRPLQIDGRLLFYKLNRNPFYLAFDDGVKQTNLRKDEVLSCPLAFAPTKAEQEAIAEALSDADALIESLEQLIAKKRHLKQGAMQELLRPKAGWESTNLGSIADPNQRWSFTGGPFGSNLKSSDYTDDGVRIIQLQNIGAGEFQNDYEVFTSTQKADELLSCNIHPGEINLSKLGDPVARACIIPSHHQRYLMCSDGIRLAVNQKRFNTYFVHTVINARDFRTKAESASTGSTRKRIGLIELRNLELLCPALPEQTAIAAILRDMDAEIDALEAKLVKARQLKQGMMHLLLTGKVRLV